MPPETDILIDWTRKAVRGVWQDEYHGLLPLPPPIVSFLPPEHPHFTTGRYFIEVSEMNNWQIHLNFGSVEDLAKPRFDEEVRVLLRHEIGHYTRCPFDLLRHMRIIHAALRILKEDPRIPRDKALQFSLAASLGNQMADVLVDTWSYRNHPAATLRSEQRWCNLGPRETEPEKAPRSSAASDLLFAVKQTLWNESLNRPFDPRSIEAAEELCPLLEAVLAVTGAEVRAQFAPLAEAYTRTWLSLLDDEDIAQLNQPGSEGTPSPTFIPDEDDMACLAQECSLEDFVTLAEGAALADKRTAEIIWYEEHALEWSNPFRIPRTADALISYPERWKISDPVDALDIPLSLHVAPIMIPGLTTRKWSRGPALQNTGSKDIPDLLIVLDASGSMEQAKINGDSTPLHIARLAAFSILNTYTQLAANTAGIIFSDRYRSADWNRDQSQLRELLVSQAGGNTVFPVARTTALVQQTTTKKAVIILTDGELHNRTAAMPALAALLEQGHKIMIYMINANPFDPAPYEHYLSAGGVIQVVKSPDDICSETWEQIG